jgi:uracil phosphoribosyltransferase
MSPSRVTVVDHPAVQHKLTLMRERTTTTATFRALLKEISMLLAYETTRDLPLVDHTVETPVATVDAKIFEGKKLVFVGVLRAGQGILDGFLEVFPSARVGHIGLSRDEETLEPSEYYYKVPPDLTIRDVVLVDPMLATGGSAVAALDRLAAERPRSLKLACLLAAPEGIERVHSRHPDVPVYTAAIDDHLDENGYIVPGLGDAGDRMFGTK